MLKNWLKIAFANYRKDWVATLINLLGLTVGLTGFMLILLHWNDEASYEAWNPNRKEIYFTQQKYDSEGWTNRNMSYQMVQAAVDEIPEILDYVLFGYNDGTGLFRLPNGKTYYSKKGQGTSENFFEFLPFKLKYGSYKDALSDAQKMAISTELSEQLFGNIDPVGKEVTFQDEKYMITNVYEIPKTNTVVKPEFLILAKDLLDYRQSIKEGNNNWGNNAFQTLLRIQKSADISQVEEDIFNKILVGKRYTKEMLARENLSLEEIIEKWGPNKFILTRFDKAHLHAPASFKWKGDYKTIKILFGLSILILVLSVINFINLKTAQASQRAKEVGVRKVLGSNRTGIIFQFIFETAFLCIVAYFLSLLLTELLLPSFNKFLSKEMALNSFNVLLYSSLAVLITMFFAGLIPAFYLSNFKPINTLKGNFSRSKHGIFLRNGILGLQIVISSFFIIGSLIVRQQVQHIMNKELGFNGDQVISVWFSDGNTKHTKYERLRTEMAKIKGVDAVTFGEASPTMGGSSSNVDWQEKSLTAQHGSMDYNYLDFFEIPLLKGRGLDPKFSSDTINNALVNESFVNRMGWQIDEAVGKKVKPGFDNEEYNIIGVVKNYNVWNASSEIPPIIYFHYMMSNWKRDYMFFMQAKLDKNDIEGTLKRLDTFWSKNAEPGYPFEYYFVDKRFEQTYLQYKRQKTLYNILNGIVLTVALLGLFALSALLIEQKLKTVAIKKTLGASTGELIFGLTKQFLIITAIAVLISIPISYYFMNEWLKDFAYRINMPWWPYVASLLVLLALTFLVVSFKAFRATKISLSKYLKYE